MKKIAESLGMAEPEIDYGSGSYEAGDKEVTTLSEIALEGVPQVSEEETEYEEARLKKADEDVDYIVQEAKATAREIIELSADMDPRYQARSREVGAAYLKIALEGANKKQQHVLERRKDRRDKAVMGTPGTVSSTQINNIYGNREEILRALRKENKEDD